MSDHNFVSDQFIELWPGKSRPEISILMPVYQNQRFIQSAVTSVLAQRGVIAEVIISDDASSDETFNSAIQAARKWFASHGSDHRLVMRKGSKRLWRDHLALLVDHASCDIVCQAHGDDESHPDRARALVGVFRALPNAALLTSEVIAMDEDGGSAVNEWLVNSDVSYARYDFESIINGHTYLIGAAQSWRRNLVDRFKRLDRDFAAVAHDRILPFRSSLVGDVYLVKAPLIKRRDYAGAAHKLMFDEPETNGRFGWSLVWMTHLDAMLRDLDQARSMALVTDGLYAQLANTIRKLSQDCSERLLESYRVQTRSGRQIAWVDDATLVKLRKSRAN